MVWPRPAVVAMTRVFLLLLLRKNQQSPHHDLPFEPGTWWSSAVTAIGSFERTTLRRGRSTLFATNTLNLCKMRLLLKVLNLFQALLFIIALLWTVTTGVSELLPGALWMVLVALALWFLVIAGTARLLHQRR